MKINEDTIKGKWLEIRGEFQKIWGKLTDDELDKTQGDIKAISGLIQQKYGEAQETYMTRVSAVFAQFESKRDATVRNIKDHLKKLN
jgi:uncharacterized protein YjbJ (UPF0337 family)